MTTSSPAAIGAEPYTTHPASVAQRLLWMIRHYRHDVGTLSCPMVARLEGPLEVGRLRAALRGLTARHESMRTTFGGRGARLHQRVHPERELPLAVVPVDEQEIPLAMTQELSQPVDVAQWPARAVLWRISPTRHVLCLTIDHLVTDAWSTGLLLRDLCALYAGRGHELPEVGWQYSRFATWQAGLLAGDGLDRHRAYWVEQLAGVRIPRVQPPPDSRGEAEVSDVHAGQGRTGDAGPQSGSVQLDLPPPTVAGVRRLAAAQRITASSVLLAGFLTQLAAVTGETDVAAGSMLANRSRPQLRDTVGLLANMVLLRAQVDPAEPFRQLAGRVHAVAMGAQVYQDLPFHLMPLERADLNGARPDEVVFNVMAEVEHRRQVGDLAVSLIVPREMGGRFPLELALAGTGPDRFTAVLFHSTGLLGSRDAGNLLAGYQRLLAVATAAPDTPTGLLQGIGRSLYRAD